MKDEEKRIKDEENPFIFIQPSDRRKLLKILYPTIDFNLIFYPKMDNDEVLDEFGIPHTVLGSTESRPYIITTNPELRKYLQDAVMTWYKSKINKINNLKGEEE